MSSAPNKPVEEVNWDGVIQQIYDMINTDTAIIDRYGIILASKIKEFQKGNIISPLIWDLITKREKLKKELGVKEISNLVLETDSGNIVFTFGKYIYLLAIVPNNVNLAQFMPSIGRIIVTLDKSSNKEIALDIEQLDLSKEYLSLSHEKDPYRNADRFPIFKTLISQLAKK